MAVRNSSYVKESQLRKLEDVTAACNRCGFCTSFCPTYLATGSELHSPRGRNQMFRALLDGRIKDPRDIIESVNGCLLCGECTTICFSEVPTADLMIQARSLIHRKKGMTASLNWFLYYILPNNKGFRWLLKFFFLVKNLKIPALLKKTGLLQKHAPEISAADDLMVQMPLQFLFEKKEAKPYLGTLYQDARLGAVKAQMELDRAKRSGRAVAQPTSPVVATRAKIAYFPPCGSQYLKPDIGLATLKLLKAMKVPFIIPDLICCGLPAASLGVLDQVRAMAQENIQRLENQGFEHIVIDDSSCGAHVKDYPKYFLDDPIWLPRAQALVLKVRELSSFLLHQNLPQLLQSKTWQGGPIAYHDPCKAQYGQKNTASPRDLLENIRGLKIIPVGDSDQCCGGGGTYSFSHPDISRAVLAAKVKNLAATEAKIVVTSSASCLVQVAYGLRQNYPDVEVLHLSEFLARALEQQR